MSLLDKVRSLEWKNFNRMVNNLEAKYSEAPINEVVNLDNLKRYKVTNPIDMAVTPAPQPKRTPKSPTKEVITPRWCPPPNSLVYDIHTQYNALRNLYMLLAKGDPQSKVVKNKLIKRAMKTLNLTSLPPVDVVQPFFEFGDDREINVSFLFHQPGSSWSARNEAYYGSGCGNMLSLQKQIYSCLLGPENRGLVRESMIANSQDFTSTPRKSLRILNRTSARDSAFEDAYFEELSDKEETEATFEPPLVSKRKIPIRQTTNSSRRRKSAPVRKEPVSDVQLPVRRSRRSAKK